MMWPLPALCVWALAWGLFAALVQWGVASFLAFLGACACGLLAAGFAAQYGWSRWRQGLMALGFPASAAASGVASGWPAWAWLIPLLLLLLLYPLRSWRDAPLFPTPYDALQGLAAATALPNSARLMDAGCGLGDGLLALRREYPTAQITGLEWSLLLHWLCRWRCLFAGTSVHVQRADIWQADWSAYDLVYVFQRPESMARAFQKARAELRPGAWLVSLEFEVAGQKATSTLDTHPGKPVWLYRMPG
jgi:SAM-dependent methyltransferase